MDRASAQSSTRDQEIKARSVLDALERLIILKRQKCAEDEAEYKLRSTQLAKYRQNQEDEFKARLSSLQEELDEREADVSAREKVNASIQAKQIEREEYLNGIAHDNAVRMVRLDTWEANLKESARCNREEEARIAGMRDEAETYHEEAAEAWQENKRILKTTKEDLAFSKKHAKEMMEKTMTERARLQMEREGFDLWKAETEKRIVEKERQLDIRIKTAEQLYGKNG